MLLHVPQNMTIDRTSFSSLRIHNIYTRTPQKSDDQVQIRDTGLSSTYLHIHPVWKNRMR